jgi:hypothetical protein
MAGTAQYLHLARTARLAGEAFALVDVEPDASTSAPRRTLVLGGLAWTFVGVVAAAALYLGF